MSLGLPEKPALDLLAPDADPQAQAAPFTRVLVRAGARDLAEHWASRPPQETDPAGWRLPDRWFEADHRIVVGTRALDAVHTPGHTPGHYVFADEGAGLLFAGDHVLPTITPSIGFTVPPVPDPLGDFMASLTRVRSLPDLTILPAHGPVAPSSHTRVDELTAHHEDRLRNSLAGLDHGAQTAHEVAQQLTWTRHERSYTELDEFSQGLATMETKAHLDLLVARGAATAVEGPDGTVFSQRPTAPPAG
ncbi:MBL fold metallo-hydrolase [Pseudonocardia lutea]|uniref:MBL fold metallo-hydrolase n=1 Tax=Pseudonocardia lutea TaxID=2172015 RepID=A0ABW1I9S3_9PSEU